MTEKEIDVQVYAFAHAATFLFCAALGQFADRHVFEFDIPYTTFLLLIGAAIGTGKHMQSVIDRARSNK